MPRTGHVAVALNHLARNAPATLAWGVALVFILVVTTLFIRANLFRLWQRLIGLGTLSLGRLSGRSRLRPGSPPSAEVELRRRAA